MIVLSLEGIHAKEYDMHIQEVGQDIWPTLKDVGGHFNPTDVEHVTKSENCK